MRNRRQETLLSAYRSLSNGEVGLEILLLCILSGFRLSVELRFRSTGRLVTRFHYVQTTTFVNFKTPTISSVNVVFID